MWAKFARTAEGGKIYHVDYYNLDVIISVGYEVKTIISRHIKNILSENECHESNLQKMQIPQSDKPIVLYDLEIIISVGYRVKSMRCVMFRRWANSVLKQYLINGHAINESRCLAHSENIITLSNPVKNKLQNK